MEVIFLLQAELADGSKIALFRLTKQEISQLKQQESFYCPECKDEVIIKAGEKVIPHFAHQTKTACCHSGEGAYHENGKMDLFEWFRNQKIPVMLEVYLKEIKQRPDLLVKLGSKTIAIEYQCATISTKEMIKRSNQYRAINIIPIWILGGNRIKRISNNQLRISKLDATYIHQFHENFPHTLYYYCSKQKLFLLYRDIHYLSASNVIANMTIYPLQEATWKELFTVKQLNKGQLVKAWKYELSNWRNRPVPFHNRAETAFRQWLYLNHFSVHTLPYYTHLPIANQMYFKLPPWVWQSRLYIQLIVKKKKFTLNEAEHLLRKHLINPSEFPLLSFYNHPIAEYFQLLERIGILRSNGQNMYEVIRVTV